MNALTSHEKTLSLGSLGGLCMISGSGGATPRASAGSPSVIKLMYKIAAGSRGKYSGPDTQYHSSDDHHLCDVAPEEIGEVFLYVIIDSTGHARWPSQWSQSCHRSEPYPQLLWSPPSR